MVQLSRKKLPKETISKLFILFFEVVGKKTEKEEFQSIVNDLFSPIEQLMVIKRIAIVYLLLKEINLLTIAEVLNVSPSTISKYSTIIERRDGLVYFLKKIVFKEKIANFFEEVFSELFYRSGVRGVNWKEAWKLKMKIQEKKLTGL